MSTNLLYNNKITCENCSEIINKNNKTINKLISKIKKLDSKCKQLESSNDINKKHLCEVNNTINFSMIDITKELQELKEKIELLSINQDPNNIISGLSIHNPDTKSFPKTQFYDKQWNMKILDIETAWEMGYTGKNINIMIIDSGVDSRHPDLSQNFNSNISLPINNGWIPNRLSEGHGTSCASIACGTGTKYVTGVAYNATLSAAYCIGFGNVISTSTALSTSYDTIDIYSNSWGTNVQSVGIGIVRRGYFKYDLESIKKGIEYGRPYKDNTSKKPRGCIYLFAAGNDGMNHDITTWQEVLNTPYTIAVGAINHLGKITKYSTPGTSILVSGPGGNDPYAQTPEPGCIAATPCIGNSMRYTTSFNGTSAATPHISGICALMLEANPDLTWRDIQHILVYGSKHPTNIDSAILSSTTGLCYSMYYGYGLPNAGICCKLAKNWIYLPEMIETKIINTNYNDIIPTDENGINYLIKDIDIDKSYTNSLIERIILSVNISSEIETDKDIAMIADSMYYNQKLDNRQIDVSIKLISPAGTSYEIVRPVSIDNIQNKNNGSISGIPISSNTYTFDIDMKCEGYRDELFNQDISGNIKPWKIAFVDKYKKYNHRLMGIELEIQGYKLSKDILNNQINMLNNISDMKFLAESKSKLLTLL